MSWSRPRYDDSTFKHRLAETIGPGEYMTQTPKNCDNCVYYAPGVALDRKGVALCDTQLIDVDSELMGITRKYSQCPANKYLPNSKPFCEPNLTTYKECVDLVPEPTLISNPKCTNKETTVNRWEWLCQNPQTKALMPFDYMINNQLVVKDNHRPLIERPLDQSDALPPPCNNNIRYDWASRYAQPSLQFPSTQLATCKNIQHL
jgi:hypothetical protein